MKTTKRLFCKGLLLIGLFAVWTLLVQTVDVQPAGEMGTEIGLATFNSRFHNFTGVHLGLYVLTDWLGLVPVGVCMFYGVMGFYQLVKRKSLLRVDFDILLLGVYYVIVAAGYLIFEMFPVNYRPILIEGRLEASYPSSTTLLVLSVMPTLALQINRRSHSARRKKTAGILTGVFSLLMVIGRLVSGVHWATDIVGAVFLSSGLFCLYKAAVMLYCKEEQTQEGSGWNFVKSCRN